MFHILWCLREYSRQTWSKDLCSCDLKERINTTFSEEEHLPRAEQSFPPPDYMHAVIKTSIYLNKPPYTEYD
jgi:hypothetical protein